MSCVQLEYNEPHQELFKVNNLLSFQMNKNTVYSHVGNCFCDLGILQLSRMFFLNDKCQIFTAFSNYEDN